MPKPFLLAFALITASGLFCCSMSNQGDGGLDACKLNDLVYMEPPMNSWPVGCEYAEQEKNPTQLMNAAGLSERDVVLLALHWIDKFVEADTSGHDIPTAIIFYKLDPISDAVTIIKKLDVPDFVEQYPEIDLWPMACHTEIPDHSKEYGLHSYLDFDYCNPPKVLSESLWARDIPDGHEYYIPLPLE